MNLRLFPQSCTPRDVPVRRFASGALSIQHLGRLLLHKPNKWRFGLSLGILLSLAACSNSDESPQAIVKKIAPPNHAAASKSQPTVEAPSLPESPLKSEDEGIRPSGSPSTSAVDSTPADVVDTAETADTAVTVNASAAETAAEVPASTAEPAMTPEQQAAEAAKLAAAVVTQQSKSATAESQPATNPTAAPARKSARVPGRIQDITFDDIKFEMEKGDPFERSMLTPEIEDLVGTPIRIRGYILPASVFTQSGFNRFILVRDNQECCFGPGAALFDAIIVEMEPGKTADYNIFPVALEGTFSVREMLGPGGTHLAIYHVKGTAVK